MVLNPTLLLIYSAFYSRKMVIHCHLFMTMHSPDHMHKSHTGIPKFQMFSATTNSQDPCHFTDRFLWISAKTILKRIKAILGKIPREYRSVHYHLLKVICSSRFSWHHPFMSVPFHSFHEKNLTPFPWNPTASLQLQKWHVNEKVYLPSFIFQGASCCCFKNPANQPFDMHKTLQLMGCSVRLPGDSAEMSRLSIDPNNALFFPQITINSCINFDSPSTKMRKNCG